MRVLRGFCGSGFERRAVVSFVPKLIVIIIIINIYILVVSIIILLLFEVVAAFSFMVHSAEMFLNPTLTIAR